MRTLSIEVPVQEVEAELHISPKLVLALIPLFGVLLYGMGEAWSGSVELLRYVLLVLFLYALSVVGWLLSDWRPLAGRWYTVAILVATVYSLGVWLRVPGSLALAAIPVVFSAALIGLRAAVATALCESLLLVPSWRYGRVDLPAVGVAFLSAWSGLGAIWAIYGPARTAVKWSLTYYERAQRLLEEARNHRAELSQALEDLAHANEQLTRLNSVAQGLRHAAEDARAAKEQFVANVSHELRTPLNMIIGFSEMIVQSPEAYGSRLPPSLLADLAVIRRNAEHLADLIDDVLDLSQIEADQMALSKEYVRFQEIIELASTAVRPLFDSRGLHLETEIPDDLPPVFCDRTRIREVMLNLLSNAGRFTEQGGVYVRAWQDGNDLIVSVADTGRGIAAEDMSKLFQPFQQVDGSIRRRYGGSGLGLSISKRFIELHGGRIWVESEKGVGTVFFFRLPVIPPAPVSGDFSRWLAPQWEHLQRPRRSDLSRVEVRPRLVVLEEGDALRRLVARYLGDWDVVSTHDLDETLRDLNDHPSHALLANDVAVNESLRRLKEAALPYGLPVIACSVPGVGKSIGGTTVADYLVKPVSREALLTALDRLNLEGNTVLVVDDQPEALRLFRRMLVSSPKGYRVLRAKDGQEALNLVREYRPDVMLLDLVMPRMDGFQLLEAKSQVPELQDIPVIVISARDPLGRPIVSSGLTVTREGGLSARNLLQCIAALIQILSPLGQVAGPTPRARPSG